MKKVALLMVLVFSLTQVWAQETKEKEKEDRNFRIPLIGETAPSFTAESTGGLINFPLDYGRKWKILFSHPQDFTPVCSSEILELANLQEDFDKLNVKLVVVSTDALDTHFAWKKAMEDVEFKGRIPSKIKFPLVDDSSIAISKQYGMIHPESNTTKSVRGVFVIDPDNVIQAIYFYPMSIGRNTDELIRTVQALQATAKTELMTPADWRAGHDLIAPVPPTADQRTENTPDGYYKLAWFMWYKKAK